jgi:hypothetical protein
MPGTTPVYGFPYPEPTDLVADYPALGQQLAEDIEAVLPTLGGLTLISPTSIANTGGTATSTSGTTTFTTASSVSVNGVFSAAYANYRVMITFTTSTTAVCNMRYRAAGTDNTASAYSIRGGDQGAFTSAGADATAFALTTGYTGGNSVVLDITNPFAAQYTLGPFETLSGTVSVAALARFGSLGHFSTSSFDGFTVYMASGNFTGKIRVYGWKGA